MANLANKWHIKNRFYVKCKTLTNRKNYCIVRILSEDPEHKDLNIYIYIYIYIYRMISWEEIAEIDSI